MEKCMRCGHDLIIGGNFFVDAATYVAHCSLFELSVLSADYGHHRVLILIFSFKETYFQFSKTSTLRKHTTHISYFTCYECFLGKCNPC